MKFFAFDYGVPIWKKKSEFYSLFVFIYFTVLSQTEYVINNFPIVNANISQSPGQVTYTNRSR